MQQIGLSISVALALAAAFAAAAWVASAIWAYYDVARRTQDIYVRMFATLMVLVFGPIGAVLYLILRPRETLDDAYLRALQEEALLREISPSGVTAPPKSLLAINGHAPTIGRNVFIAPGARLIGDVRLGDGVSIWYNTVIRADIAPVIIGAGTNIQDGCVLHVDADAPLHIGANVTVGHMAVLHACTVEDECLIGIQSTVLSNAHIRQHSVVAAAALVSEGKDFPEASLLVGIPAREVRTVNKDEIQHLIVDRAADYRSLAAGQRTAGHSVQDETSPA